MNSNLNTVIIIDDTLISARLRILYPRHNFRTICVFSFTINRRLNAQKNLVWQYSRTCEAYFHVRQLLPEQTLNHVTQTDPFQRRAPKNESRNKVRNGDPGRRDAARKDRKDDWFRRREFMRPSATFVSQESAAQEKKRRQSGSRDRRQCLCGWSRGDGLMRAQRRGLARFARQHGKSERSARLSSLTAAVDVTQRVARKFSRLSTCRRVPKPRSTPHWNPLNGRIAARIVFSSRLDDELGRNPSPWLHFREARRHIWAFACSTSNRTNV